MTRYYSRVFFYGQVMAPAPTNEGVQYLTSASEDEGFSIERVTAEGSDDFVVKHKDWNGGVLELPAQGGAITCAYPKAKGAKK